MTPAQIAANLAAIARSKNLNQSAIAEKSGVPQGTISRVFSGKVRQILKRSARSPRRLEQG